MLRAIYKTGSSLILPKPKDIDTVYYYDNNLERLEALKRYKHKKEDIHFRIFNNEPYVFLGCYIYHFMELIEGEENLKFKDFSIFNNDEYLKCLKKYYDFLPDKNKKWYHIIIAMYLYKNNEYKLTKQQIEVAQFVHDNGITPELKQEIKEYFKWEEI